jgi:hypothetical protein
MVVLAWGITSGAANAQVSLVGGDWIEPHHEDEMDRGGGPAIGDYMGVPLNDAARQYADTWDAAEWSEPEFQCAPHTSAYMFRGPSNFYIWEEKEPSTQALVAIKMFSATYAQTRTIWMDGRPHPSPYAPHTFMGFSTGRFDGRSLIVRTTHIKRYWHKRDGVPQSDRVTFTEQFFRHGDMLTHVSIKEDPVYLTEPLVQTETFVLNLDATPATFQTHLSCSVDQEIADWPKGHHPHHLPGENNALTELAEKLRIPFEITRGGAEQMYPEYQLKIRQLLARPDAPAK